jgi:hypothetical protein
MQEPKQRRAATRATPQSKVQRKAGEREGRGKETKMGREGDFR